MLLRYLIINLFLIFQVSAESRFHHQNRKILESKIFISLQKHRFFNIYGLSGMGKTTIARDIANVLESKGYKVIWLDWDPFTLEEQLKAKLQNHNCNSIEDFISLSSRVKSLIIIIDNYNETNLSALKNNMHEFYSPLNVKFLITSRKKILNIEGIQVPPFTDKEALQLMRSYFPEEEEERLSKLARDLGFYPYFISLVCSLINTSNTINIKRIEDIMENNPQEIMVKDFSMSVPGDKANSPGNMAIKDTLKELREKDQNTYLCLGFMSMLNSKSIPIELIHAFLKDGKEGDRVIDKLCLLTFISHVNKNKDVISYDLHEITQKIVFEFLTEKEKSIILISCIDAFFNYYTNEFSRISEANKEDQVFFNHLLSVISKYDNEEAVIPLRILSVKREIYSKRNASNALIQAREIDEYNPEVNIKNIDILFEYFVDWAFLYCFHYTDDKLKFLKGIRYGQRAIEIAKSLNNNQRLFKSNTRLMWVNLYAGNIEDSESFFNVASNLLSEINDPYLLKEYYFGAAWFFIDKGEFDKAYGLSCQGVNLDDRSKNVNVGLYLRSFKALCEYKLGKKEEATRTIQEALEREFKEFGNNASLARSELLQVSAMIHLDSKNLDDARRSIQESLRIVEKIKGKGPYHPKAISWKIFAEILLAENKLEEADEAVMTSIKIFSQLIENQPTFEWGESLILKLKIDLLRGNYESFSSTYSEVKSLFAKEQTLLNDIKKYALDLNKEWLLH